MNYSPNSAAQHADNAAYKSGRNAYVNILHSTKKPENYKYSLIERPELFEAMQNYYKSVPPNDNWMPGLSYLGEIIFSGVLGVWSIVNLVVTIITVLMIKRKNA